MYKKILSFILIGLVPNLFCYSTVKANSEKEAKFAAKVKTAITQLGTGENARVEIKLRDKIRIEGYVNEINDNDFVVVNDKTGISTQIQYSQVTKAKGKNNLTGEQIVIGVIIAALIVIGALYGLDKID